MPKPIILAAAKMIDGKGDLQAVLAAEEKLQMADCKIAHLSIDPLAKGWHSPLEARHFRSGCAPIEALACACEMISQAHYSAVVIAGVDNLKTDYADKHDKRERLMNIYGEHCPLPEAYTQLAYAFIDNVKTTSAAFKSMAEKLYENYQRTARKEKTYRPPDEKWFRYITDLFRGIDCANPSVDFSGKMVIGNKTAADLCAVPVTRRISVLGVGIDQTGGDGPEHLTEIASYDHLKRAFAIACQQAGIKFCEMFLKGKALLEVYSCYPVVPMAFLLASGIAGSFDEIGSILDRCEVTVTGGMNIARAPWNNPALHALVCMYEKICSGAAKLGAVHGNGGLGFKQGVALLGFP